jgi:hypothetical protein
VPIVEYKRLDSTCMGIKVQTWLRKLDDFLLRGGRIRARE